MIGRAGKGRDCGDTEGMRDLDRSELKDGKERRMR